MRELLVVMRANDMGLQMVDGMIASLKDALPGAPDEYWVAFRAKVKGSDLIDLAVPVYAKHLETRRADPLLSLARSPAIPR